jgi:hypothetical protein
LAPVAALLAPTLALCLELLAQFLASHLALGVVVGPARECRLDGQQQREQVRPGRRGGGACQRILPTRRF